MKNIFLTPGPSQLYPTFGKHFKSALKENIPSISHRGEVFMNLVKSIKENLSELLGIPKTHRIYFLSSATECMERIIGNCVEKKSFHFVNGSFSNLFYKNGCQSWKRSLFE